jgi:hypothetical protein
MSYEKLNSLFLVSGLVMEINVFLCTPKRFPLFNSFLFEISGAVEIQISFESEE